ncbi:MAG TPA: J domain-containing protein [Dehalococcoidia bacterium]|nr:J domain-containing protein [Dehalococcoidia bacterium]
MNEPDHYATLQVHPDVTDAEIKRAYRRLMRAVHPDANTHDPDANRKAALLNDAFEVVGDVARRRAYDDRRGHASVRRYQVWAEQPDWEDIVAEHVSPPRPAHVHRVEPRIEPDEIEVSVAETRARARVRRSLRIVNDCDCTLTGDVSTSEPWVWGPIGAITVGPGRAAAFDVEVVSSRVRFPGISRVVFVAGDWTGVVPVKITGYEPKRRRPPATDATYVPPRRRRAVKPR